MGFPNIFSKKKKDNEFIEDEEYVTEEFNQDSKEHLGFSDNIVPFTNRGNTQNPTVVRVAPISFDDAQAVADYIKGQKAVIVNFENTNTDVAKRIIDFMSGTVYALGGKLTKVGKNVFMCSPSNVTVESDDEGKHSYKNQNAPVNPWEN